MSQLRVVLADEQPAFRTGLRAEILRFDDLEIIGEARSGAETLFLTMHLKPDVLVLDVAMTDLSGEDIARQLNFSGAPVRILALSATPDQQLTTKVLASGVSGYMLKNEDTETLVEAIRGVGLKYGWWYSRAIMDQMRSIERPYQLPDAQTGISDRELEILSLLAQGFPRQQIALALALPDQMIETYLNTICRKLGVSSQREAASLAWRNGWIKTPKAGAC